jgi:hypothetical protein
MKNSYYRVMHGERHMKSFPTRDQALAFVMTQEDPEEYEILDRSDY